MCEQCLNPTTDQDIEAVLHVGVCYQCFIEDMEYTIQIHDIDRGAIEQPIDIPF